MMKYTLILISLFISGFSLANGPDSFYKIQEEKVTYEDQRYPALVVTVDVSEEYLKETWKNYVKDTHGVKLDGYGFLTNKDVLSATEEQFEGLSTKRADMYTRFISLDENTTKIELFMTLGYDIKISSENYEGIFESLENSFMDYMNIAVPGYYEQEVNELTKELRSLTRDLKKVQRKASNASEDLKNNTEDIQDNQEEIEELREENEELRQELDTKSEKQLQLEQRAAELKERIESRRAQINSVEIK